MLMEFLIVHEAQNFRHFIRPHENKIYIRNIQVFGAEIYYVITRGLKYISNIFFRISFVFMKKIYFNFTTFRRKYISYILIYI